MANGANMFCSGDHIKTNDVGRPATSWVDDLRKVDGSGWMRAAEHSESWRAQAEAYAQQ